MNRRSLLRAILVLPFVRTVLPWLPKSVSAGVLFSPRYYEVSVPIYMEEVRANFFKTDSIATLLQNDYLAAQKHMGEFLEGARKE